MFQGKISLPDRAPYAASKHACQAFYDSLRAELAHRNIYVSVLNPGYIRTNLSVNAITGEPYVSYPHAVLELDKPLTVLTIRNETWRLWKRISKFFNSNFLLAVWSKLSIVFTHKLLHELGNKKILFYKLSVRYLVVKLACVNAALACFLFWYCCWK